jgi:hypothetical protein
MRHRVLPRITPLAISILVVLTLLVPAAYFSFPHLYRWRMLQGLNSADDDRRARALGYVAGLADENEAVRDGAIARLDDLNDRPFRDLVASLQAAESWDRALVGDGAWLRWIRLAADNEDAQARIAAAHLLAELPDLSGEARLRAVLEKLIADDDADVRFNTLFVAAELWAAGAQGVELEQLIASRTQDDEPAIARHAWLLLGLIDPLHGFVADWQDAPPDVAEAILWAAVRTNPRAIAPAAAALRDEHAALRVRAAGAYALSLSTDPAAQAALRTAIPDDLPSIGEEQMLVTWRAILGSQTTDPLPASPTALPEALQPLRFALAYQTADLPDEEPDPAAQTDWLHYLAALEGRDATANATASAPPLSEFTPPLHRLAYVAAGLSDDPNDLNPVFRSEVSTLRDLACLVAFERFDAATLESVVVNLLTDYNDAMKMSGGILAGLTGLQSELLAKRHEFEDQPDVRAVFRLGLWMQGRDELLDADGAMLLIDREALGIGSTVLLAMLHVGRFGNQPAVARTALDYLLNPRGEPEVDLRQLFDQLRWWRVLAFYLPELFDEQPPPRFWLWGDPMLQRFQIDVLRDWYLLQRHRLKES